MAQNNLGHRQKPAYRLSPSRPYAIDDPVPEPVPFPIKIVQEPAPLPDIPLSSLIPPKPKSDYFYPAWDKFLAVQPSRAKTVRKDAKKLKKEKEVVEEKQPEGLQYRENAAKSYEQAASECREKVAAIIEECKRLNQKYIDALFNIEDNAYTLCDLTGKVPDAVGENGEEPPWIKRVEDIFDKPEFYIDGATANDVHQGFAGDCWFLAALMAISAKPDLIHKLCVARDEKFGVYGFVFYRDGEWTYEVIDDKLYMRVGDDDDVDIVRNWDKSGKGGQYVRYDRDKLKEKLQSGGEALYFSHCKSNETWLPLVEKAYAKAHGDYTSIEGGWPSEGIEDLTGGVATNINPEDIMDKDLFWREQMSKVNDKYLFGGASKMRTTKGVIGGHAYSVLQAWEEGDLKLLKIKNPWGESEWDGDWSDGSKLWTPEMLKKLDHKFGDDGIFWMSYKDFFKHFPNVSRVRLFDDSWQVSQSWTCVDVPWTVDYLDTRFELSITEKTPIVAVLSQPDSRYFVGLEGRYRFALHFRLYRNNESGHKYLMRSMHSSGNDWKFTRSVSAELSDLDPGKYFIIFKITATRFAHFQTAEDAVVKFAIDRKEKLLDVGRRYDFAQTKGNLRAMEKADRKQKRDEAKEELTDKLRQSRKLNKLERERNVKLKNRIREATQEKLKAYHEKKVARRNEIRAKQKAKKEARQKEKQAANVKETGSSDTSTTTESVKLTPATTIAEEKIEDAANDVAKALEDVKLADNEASSPSVVAVVDLAAAETTTEAFAGQATTAGAEQTEIKATEAATQTEESEAQAQPTGARGTTPVAEQGTVVVAVVDDGSQQEQEEVSSSDEEWEPEITPPASIADDDFSWDSDIDGMVDGDASSVSSDAAKDIDIFEGEPWSARCVVGLRVYSKSEVKITVRTTDDEDEENEAEV